MGKVLAFPSPGTRKRKVTKLSVIKKILCVSCKGTDKDSIIESKLCFGIKRFFIFGKEICGCKTAHFHKTCKNCKTEWIED